MSAPATTQTIAIPATLPDGSVVTLRVDRTALAELAQGLRAPEEEKILDGYEALRVALLERGIRYDKRTLKRMVQHRRIPSMKFGRRRRFYVNQVIERMGGRCR